jgi:hypothetical protein
MDSRLGGPQNQSGRCGVETNILSQLGIKPRRPARSYIDCKHNLRKCSLLFTYFTEHDVVYWIYKYTVAKKITLLISHYKTSDNINP